MLRDLIGETELKKSIHKYRGDEDRSPQYVEKLVESESTRDLAWFFEDWVYQDKGLPEFRIDSAFQRKTDKGTYLLTVTIVNDGLAGGGVSFSGRLQCAEM